MISIVSGDTGHGKGLFALNCIEHGCRQGRPVLTNIRLHPACPFYDHVYLIDDEAGEYPVYRGEPAKGKKAASDDYKAFWHYTPRGALVVLDECDDYFDCTDHSAVGRDIRRFLKQQRKRQVDIVFISQVVSNIYVRIRRLAQRFVHCEWGYRSMLRYQTLIKPTFGEEFAKRSSMFYRYTFHSWPYTDKNMQSCVAIPYGRIAAKYFKTPWYDTDQVIGDLDG